METDTVINKSFLTFWKGINFNSSCSIKILIKSSAAIFEISNTLLKNNNNHTVIADQKVGFTTFLWVRKVGGAQSAQDQGQLSPSRKESDWLTEIKESMSSPLCVLLLYRSHDTAAAGRVVERLI